MGSSLNLRSLFRIPFYKGAVLFWGPKIKKGPNLESHPSVILIVDNLNSTPYSLKPHLGLPTYPFFRP